MSDEPESKGGGGRFLAVALVLVVLFHAFFVWPDRARCTAAGGVWLVNEFKCVDLRTIRP